MITAMNDILEKIYEIDHAILLYIQENLRIEFLTPLMKTSSLFVNVGIIWILICIILICIKKTRMIGIMTLTSLALCIGFNNIIIKHLVARARPFDTYTDLTPLIKKPTDYSFASGHTTASFASVGILARFLQRPLAVLTVVFAVLVAFSRLYLGVHYPTDVLCGILIGLAGSTLVYILFKRKYNLDEYKLSRHAEKLCSSEEK